MQELPVINRSQELYEASLKITEKLPSLRRQTLGRRLENSILEMLELFIMAKHAPKSHKNVSHKSYCPSRNCSVSAADYAGSETGQRNDSAPAASQDGRNRPYAWRLAQKRSIKQFAAPRPPRHRSG